MIITVYENSNFNITCDVTATNPDLSFLNLTRPPANNVDFTEGTGAITITNVTLSNAGIYTCTAGNGETTPTTINFLLVVDIMQDNSAGAFISFP